MIGNRRLYNAAKRRYENRKHAYRKLGADIIKDITEYVNTIEEQQRIIQEQEKWIREQAKEIERLKRELFNKAEQTAKREATRAAKIAEKGSAATKAEVTRLTNFNLKQETFKQAMNIEINRIHNRFDWTSKIDEASYRGHDPGTGVAKDVGNAYTHYDELIRDWLDKRGQISISDKGLRALTNSPKFRERFMKLVSGSIDQKNEAWARFTKRGSPGGNKVLFDYRKVK